VRLLCQDCLDRGCEGSRLLEAILRLFGEAAVDHLLNV
jgi:hypothetical protein